MTGLDALTRKFGGSSAGLWPFIFTQTTEFCGQICSRHPQIKGFAHVAREVGVLIHRSVASTCWGDLQDTTWILDPIAGIQVVPQRLIGMGYLGNASSNYQKKKKRLSGWVYQNGVPKVGVHLLMVTLREDSKGPHSLLSFAFLSFPKACQVYLYSLMRNFGNHQHSIDLSTSASTTLKIIKVSNFIASHLL